MPNTLAPPDPTAGHPAQPAALSRFWISGDPDAACVRVVGELDIATTPKLERTLREAQRQARLVVLDLSDVAFIDGAGVHAIINASVRARQAGGRLVVLRGPAHVERLFDLTGAAAHLERGHAGPASRVSARPPRAQQAIGSRKRRRGLRGARATGLAHDVTPMTSVVSAAPWLRSALSELQDGTRAEAGAMPPPPPR